MWSGQFVKAWPKTMGVLALSSGESGLAAVVRAATEGLGLQSILSDFDLCGYVTVKSDATAAIGMVHRLGLGKFDIWLWEIYGFSITFVRRKFESPKCQDWSMRVMHKPSILGENHCYAIRKRLVGYLLMEEECNRPQKSDRKTFFCRR